MTWAPPAPTVGEVLYVLLGAALALLVSLGPLSWAAAPFDLLVETLVSSTADLVASLFDVVGLTEGNPSLATALAAVLSVFAPGIVALVLVLTSQATRGVRRKVAFFLVVLSLLSFFVLPATSSLTLLGCAMAFAVVVGFFEGMLVTLPLMFLATFLGVRYGVLLWEGESLEVLAASVSVSSLTGAPSTAHTWQLVFSVAGLLPFFFTLKSVLRSL